jgi:glc operon protein GlcG
MRERPTLTSADVDKLMAACRSATASKKLAVCIAITDDGGHLLRLDRADGAAPESAEIASRKACTAAVTRQTTRHWEDRVKELSGFIGVTENVLPVRGGVPLLYRDECVGGVGIAGVPPDECETIANAIAAALS